jgi:uncharacterized membrane protein YeaQ/YmgE (transglycosylase-associated protein family)
MGILAWIVVGLIAGWLAGQVMKGGGYGILVNIIPGILGGIPGGWIFGMLGIWQGSGMVASIIVAFLGAVILALITRLLKKDGGLVKNIDSSRFPALRDDDSAILVVFSTPQAEYDRLQPTYKGVLRTRRRKGGDFKLSSATPLADTEDHCLAGDLLSVFGAEIFCLSSTEKRR